MTEHECIGFRCKVPGCAHAGKNLAEGLPTEFIGGKWVMADDGEPDAMVTYTYEPSPETGHIGWCWWARGKMGDAASYELAKAAAEASLKARP